MKSLLAGVLATGLVTATASAAVAELHAPNHYACTGEGVAITYGTAGDEPSLELRQGARTLQLAAPSETLTGMGRVVSGLDPYLADATNTFTLILPRVLLSSGSETQEFDAMLVDTFSGMSLLGRPLPGVQDQSTYVPVRCRAALVTN